MPGKKKTMYNTKSIRACQRADRKRVNTSARTWVSWGEGVRPGHQEQRPVHLHHHVENPYGRGVEDIADEHFVGDRKGQNQNTPAKGASNPDAEAVQ